MNGTGVDFEAFPYFLLHNVATSTFSSATSSKSAITSTSTSKVKSSANEPGESSGLSTGAKIAIGVCIPAAVLICAAICFIVWHRRRKSRAATSGIAAFDPPPAAETEQTHGSQYGGYGFKPELDSSGFILPGSVKAPQEMSARDRQYELNGRQQAELAGEFHAELDGGSSWHSLRK